jgi:hypothetical protein
VPNLFKDVFFRNFIECEICGFFIFKSMFMGTVGKRCVVRVHPLGGTLGGKTINSIQQVDFRVNCMLLYV